MEATAEVGPNTRAAAGAGSRAEADTTPEALISVATGTG
jgi:hypothetical protein